MNEFVTDTVALILRLEQRRMGVQVQQVFIDVENNHAKLHIPAMVFAEILYLSERKKIAINLQSVHIYVQRYPTCVPAPLTFEVITKAQQIIDIPELHDRLIAATAAYLGFPLLTNDLKISASAHVQTIW